MCTTAASSSRPPTGGQRPPVSRLASPLSSSKVDKGDNGSVAVPASGRRRRGSRRRNTGGRAGRGRGCPYLHHVPGAAEGADSLAVRVTGRLVHREPVQGVASIRDLIAGARH